MYEETTEYSDAWTPFLAASKNTKNYTRGRKLNSDYLGDVMNLQTGAFQTYVRKGYGLSASAADFIAEFPLPEEVERIYFLSEILDLTDRVCFHRLDKIILSDERKSELEKAKGEILALASGDAGGYLYSDSFRYFWIRSEVWAVLHRCGLNPAVPASEELINNVEKLASILAYDLDRDRIGFTFKELIAVTNAELVKKGRTKDSVAYRVNKHSGLNKSQVKNILDGEQKDTSLTMIGEIARAIGTDTILLYAEAERVALTRVYGINTSVEPENTQAETENTHSDEEILPSNVKFMVSDEENTQAETRKRKLTKSERSPAILEFCSSPRSILEIGREIGYSSRKTLRKCIAPLLSSGKLLMTVPDSPSSPNQKYVTAEDGYEEKSSQAE